MRAILGLLILFATIGAFQNCTQVRHEGLHTAAATSGGNGNGYDGKLYNLLDPIHPCSDGSIVVASLLKNESSKVFVIREACTDKSPVLLAASEYKILTEETIVYAESVFVVRPTPVTSVSPSSYICSTTANRNNEVIVQVKITKDLAGAVTGSVTRIGESVGWIRSTKTFQVTESTSSNAVDYALNSVMIDIDGRTPYPFARFTLSNQAGRGDLMYDLPFFGVQGNQLEDSPESGQDVLACPL